MPLGCEETLPELWLGLLWIAAAWGAGRGQLVLLEGVKHLFRVRASQPSWRLCVGCTQPGSSYLLGNVSNLVEEDRGCGALVWSSLHYLGAVSVRPGHSALLSLKQSTALLGYESLGCRFFVSSPVWAAY